MTDIPAVSLPDDGAEDPALKALLADLGNKDPLPGAPPTVPIKVEATELEKAKKIVKANPLAIVQAETAQKDDLSEKYKHIIAKYGDVAEEVLGKYRKDREQIQKAIDHCRDVVENGGKVPRAYIEAWVGALDTLANTNATAVKLLDSFAKFMAAGKNSDVFSNIQVNNIDGASLAELLERDRYPDELND